MVLLRSWCCCQRREVWHGRIYSWRINSLGQGTEGVAEGFGSKMEQSLQEDINLQRVKALTLIWKRQIQTEARGGENFDTRGKNRDCKKTPSKNSAILINISAYQVLLLNGLNSCFMVK